MTSTLHDNHDLFPPEAMPKPMAMPEAALEMPTQALTGLARMIGPLAPQEELVRPIFQPQHGNKGLVHTRPARLPSDVGLGRILGPLIATKSREQQMRSPEQVAAITGRLVGLWQPVVTSPAVEAAPEEIAQPTKIPEIQPVEAPVAIEAAVVGLALDTDTTPEPAAEAVSEPVATKAETVNLDEEAFENLESILDDETQREEDREQMAIEASAPPKVVSTPVQELAPEVAEPITSTSIDEDPQELAIAASAETTVAERKIGRAERLRKYVGELATRKFRSVREKLESMTPDGMTPQTGAIVASVSPPTQKAIDLGKRLATKQPANIQPNSNGDEHGPKVRRLNAQMSSAEMVKMLSSK
jgi:hypothetical protein